MTVLNMDCVAGMRLFPDDHFDSVVCDPPYELGFMGKSWDASGIAYSVEMWREALRVLKPGGHLLAFSGSRTYHRMTCAIEDAGFEVRDQIMWVYGSGFPKSLDVSKAIDKAGGDALAWRKFSAAYAAAVEASSLTHSDVDRVLGIKSSSCYWARTDHRGGMPPRHHWEQVRALLALPSEFARLYDEAEREVVGHRDRGLSPGSNHVYGEYSGDTRITAPATPAAQQWQGWGTALKPAHEPICVARKPLIGTVAANVLQWGTGAINIDACRVGSAGGCKAPADAVGHNVGTINALGGNLNSMRSPSVDGLGRWPANLIHDGSDEVLAAFPQAAGQLADASTSDTPRAGQNVYGAMRRGRGAEASADSENEGAVGFKMKPGARRLDAGSAARFFYCAKASKSDRSEGLEGFPLKAGGMVSNTSGQHMTRRDEGGAPGPVANHHPTVKPTDLMRYLCRLVTPPGGIVMDPFTGSGSTGKAAILEGFSFVGFELSAEYAAIAQARIDAARASL